MKLIHRQKKIILVSALLFFLALTVIISTVLIVKSQKKPSPHIPKKNNLPNDKPNLTKTKTETIASLEQKLSADNIRVDDLLQELKNENVLNASETNWKEYLNGATTPDELETREKKVLKIVEKLIGKTPSTPPQGTDPWLHTEDIENAYEEIEKNVNEILLLTPSITQIIQNAVGDINSMSDADKQAHRATTNEYKSKEIIFLPVNNSSTGGYEGGTGSHWSLLVYRRANEFHYYDSAGSMNLTAATNLANNFLKYLEIGGSANIIKPASCPQQSNGSDCGVFTIAFTRCLVNKFKNNPGAVDQNDFWNIETKDFEFPIAEERKKADQKNPNRRPF